MTGLARIIGTVCYVGHMRRAPGTWGSLAALPLLALIWWVGGLWLCVIAIPIAFAKGLWASSVMTRGAADHDPSEIVVDEVVGQWIALLPVLIGAAHSGAGLFALWPGWIAAFVLFRLFDIWKPWPVSWADRRSDALGVMLDDVIAGVIAGLGVAFLAGLAHGMIGL